MTLMAPRNPRLRDYEPNGRKASPDQSGDTMFGIPIIDASEPFTLERVRRQMMETGNVMLRVTSAAVAQAKAERLLADAIQLSLDSHPPYLARRFPWLRRQRSDELPIAKRSPGDDEPSEAPATEPSAGSDRST